MEGPAVPLNTTMLENWCGFVHNPHSHHVQMMLKVVFSRKEVDHVQERVQHDTISMPCNSSMNGK